MVAKSNLRQGFLIYEDMRKYLSRYEEAVSHICNRSLLNFVIYEENLIFLFISEERKSNMDENVINFFVSVEWSKLVKNVTWQDHNIEKCHLG